MNEYKNIKYFKTWMRGNWYLVLPDFQKSIQMNEPFSDEDLKKVIDDEVCQFI